MFDDNTADQDDDSSDDDGSGSDESDLVSKQHAHCGSSVSRTQEFY